MAGVVAVLFVAEQNVRTVVVTSACLFACLLSVSGSLSLCLLPVVVVVLQQLPFPVWRSGFVAVFVVPYRSRSPSFFHAILCAAPESRCRIRLPLLSHISNNQHSSVWIIT